MNYQICNKELKIKVEYGSQYSCRKFILFRTGVMREEISNLANELEIELKLRRYGK